MISPLGAIAHQWPEISPVLTLILWPRGCLLPPVSEGMLVNGQKYRRL
ncbi:MAG: hypothetical protein AB4352_08885 [Hormoscilla sp.]